MMVSPLVARNLVSASVAQLVIVSASAQGVVDTTTVVTYFGVLGCWGVVETTTVVTPARNLFRWRCRPVQVPVRTDQKRLDESLTQLESSAQHLADEPVQKEWQQ